MITPLFIYLKTFLEIQVFHFIPEKCRDIKIICFFITICSAIAIALSIEFSISLVIEVVSDSIVEFSRFSYVISTNDSDCAVTGSVVAPTLVSFAMISFVGDSILFSLCYFICYIRVNRLDPHLEQSKLALEQEQ